MEESADMDVSTLPDDVREKLAELELELSEGEFDDFLFDIFLLVAILIFT